MGIYTPKIINIFDIKRKIQMIYIHLIYIIKVISLLLYANIQTEEKKKKDIIIFIIQKAFNKGHLCIDFFMTNLKEIIP